LSLRATFLLLLFANLAFFGWTALIDVAPEPAQSESIANLPKLKLLSEVRGKPSAADPSAAGPRTSIPAATPPARSGSPTAGPSPGSGSAPSALAAVGPAASGPAGVSLPVASGVATTGVASAVASNRCVTIGPFADPQRAREAADVLRGRGFAPRGRTAASGPPEGYWVFIGGLKSPADETGVLHRLESNGISDAKAMPDSDAGRRVSVGLFNALDGAERRARAVRHLGLDAQVEPRLAEEAHWVDVSLDSSTQSLPAEGLLSLEEPGSRLEIKECPASERGTSSPTLTAAGRPRSG
jgi:SPOR domain